MPGRLIKSIVSRLPLIKRLPVFRLLAIAEIAVLARRHLTKLTAAERRRLVELLRAGRGRARNLEPGEREELASLVAKVEPRMFAGAVADKLSPVPLPKRLTQGSQRPAPTPG